MVIGPTLFGCTVASALSHDHDCVSAARGMSAETQGLRVHVRMVTEFLDDQRVVGPSSICMLLLSACLVLDDRHIDTAR